MSHKNNWKITSQVSEVVDLLRTIVTDGNCQKKTQIDDSCLWSNQTNLIPQVLVRWRLAGHIHWKCLFDKFFDTSPTCDRMNRHFHKNNSQKEISSKTVGTNMRECCIMIYVNTTVVKFITLLKCTTLRAKLRFWSLENCKIWRWF